MTIIFKYFWPFLTIFWFTVSKLIKPYCIETFLSSTQCICPDCATVNILAGHVSGPTQYENRSSTCKFEEPPQGIPAPWDGIDDLCPKQ